MQQSAMQGNYLRELEEEVVHPLPCWPILLFHLKLFVSFPINFTTAGIDVDVRRPKPGLPLPNQTSNVEANHYEQSKIAQEEVVYA